MTDRYSHENNTEIGLEFLKKTWIVSRFERLQHGGVNWHMKKLN